MTTPRPRPVGSPPPQVVASGLDAVVARIRRLHLLAGATRLLTFTGIGLLALYLVDRGLHLPVAVRAVVLLLLLALFVREFVRGIWKPLTDGGQRLDAARIVEQALPQFEGRIISTLEFGEGAPGTLEGRIAQEAAEACRRVDLRTVLTAGPTLKSAYAALAVVVAIAVAVPLGEPALDVFAQRWMLRDVDWPRETRLQLDLAPRGAAHVVRDDGVVVASHGGVIDFEVRAEGVQPGRIELVVRGEDGERVAAMTRLEDAWRGHATMRRGDTRLFVRGGDDSGEDTELSLTVVDPPRIDDPRFVLEPPAYLGQESRTVGAEGLIVDEGTRVTVTGLATGEVSTAAVWLLGAGIQVPCEIDRSGPVPELRATLVAEASDSLAAILTGPEGLATPDPVNHSLLVRPDRPPTLRVFAPPRSAIKVTSRAVVPFSVVAEDDHGVVEVSLRSARADDVTPPRAFRVDPLAPSHHRLLVDLGSEPEAELSAYTIVAIDGRDLPGRGAQSARVEGRRVEVVEVAEVQRLLADRQLRLKEAYQTIRDRQARAIEATQSLIEEPPSADDPDLVATAVSQNQVTARLGREARELAGVVNDTILNRLDSGPGAASVLERRLDDWRAQPVDETFVPATWRSLSADYGAGQFGRLDHVGRLLDMIGVALELSESLSPVAHDALTVARRDPSPERLAAARAAQEKVDVALARLLERMDEWEDYQEVLQLVETLIDDQRRLRSRTEKVLREERERP